MASIAVDDTSSQFSYAGHWGEVTDPHFFNGSAIFDPFSQNDISAFINFASLTFTFQGTSVAIFGNTPPFSDSQWFMVSIDGKPSYNTTFMDPSAPTIGTQWFQSPTLSDAKHTISLTHLASPAVDYAVVNAGPTTNLSGVTLIVDDGDPSITYKGSWTQANSFTSQAMDGPFSGRPHGNSTHRTTSVGDSATFLFSGTSVSVGGIFTWNILGTLAVNYTLDGASSIQTYTVTTATQEYVAGQRQQNNVILFQRKSLPPGQHTFEMQVINTVNFQVFELDYILYTPSFDTLASKPATTSSSQSPVHSSSQTHSFSQSTTSTSSSTAGVSLNATTSKSTPVGAVVGAVVGGIVLLLLILLFLFRKKLVNRRTSVPTQSMGSFGTPDPLYLQPYTILSPTQTSEQLDLHVISAPADSPQSLITRKRGMSRALPGSVRSTPSSAGENGELYSRMDRLQALFEDLHREVAENGGKRGDSVRAAELRGRIAELMREESTAGSTSGGGSTRGPASEIGNLPPPAYELG